MKVNLYDFDGTIYDGDSSKDFYLFCLKKNKKNILLIPKIFVGFIKYKIKLIDLNRFKEIFFEFLKNMDEIDDLVNEFWNKNDIKIKEFYLKNNKHTNDIIISASPYFLLKPITDKLKVKDLIATNVEKTSGMFLSNNCKGKEKIKRLYEIYSDITIYDAYTDSYSDKPMIDIATSAYLVKKNKIKKIK